MEGKTPTFCVCHGAASNPETHRCKSTATHLYLEAFPSCLVDFGLVEKFGDVITARSGCCLHNFLFTVHKNDKLWVNILDASLKIYAS